MTPLAQGVGVSRAFGPVLAVDDVHLWVDAGEVVGLLGANGAGKTTLIRLLLGLLRATDGRVWLFGREPSRQTRRRLGYVPQSLGLYDDLTPRENLEFAHEVFGGERAQIPVGLRPYASVPVGRLSLGVQRRLAFVQALAHRPELLVLDEPTSGVDPLARARLWETIRETADAGAGVLVTTHYMDEAEECDRLVVMTAGRVVAEGTYEAIVGDASVTVVRTPFWERAFDALEAAGISAALVGRTLRVPGAEPEGVRRALGDLPAELDQQPATLEERFLELTMAGGRA
jgi:ABC-2 type transport system ATP-binding protein/ribosome-dependent ATPase